MSPRARVLSITLAAAAAFAGVLVGVAARSGGEPAAQKPIKPRAGAPPLALDLGVRTDAEARDLREAARLYAAGQRARAETLFSRHASLEARVGQEVAAWPDGTLDGLARLAALYPKSALVQLELGLAVYWSGRGGATDNWRQAVVLQPDTSYAVTAGNLLYPQYARNLPIFVPSEGSRLETLSGTSAARQVATVAGWARDGIAGEPALGHLLYGVVLQRLGHPLSAGRQYDLAAAAAPNDPEALVAAAVGRFDKADPSAAFSRLGPLARRFPKASTVRFHLGLLLLWIGSVAQAKQELRLATTAQPGSPLAREAARYLATIDRATR